MPPSRVRIGIDVGGTFTKAVALDPGSGRVLAKSVVPTTHGAEAGVAEGVLSALRGVLGGPGAGPGDVEMVSHSTTQAVNALLESDTHRVGIVAMGVGPERREVTRRTRIDGRGTNPGRDIRASHEFLDTSRLITEGDARGAIGRLRDAGAEAIVAAEAFAVDDPSNERFVAGEAAGMGLPATSSHEVSGAYGLEIRTLTAAINASVLPKTIRVADYVEGAIRGAGVRAPLMVMKGDGGVTSMETFRTKPVLTILSGPAASVAGALLHMRVSDGIFVEVGGTSTNICVIRGGRPEVRYVTIRDHPTCIRSMDVRVLGVAGGSMITTRRGRVARVGPRSAHIAGLGYACFAPPGELEGGRIVRVRPRPGDGEYVALRCGGREYALTNTCAANALGLVGEGDSAFAGGRAARVAMAKLGEELGVSYSEAAMSVIQTSSFEITRAVSRILKEFRMRPSSARIIGAGGGASVLVPFAAKQLGIAYEKAEHADVISSIGVASSMLQEEAEVSMAEPTPEAVSVAHRRIRAALVAKGAVPESVVVDSSYAPDRAVLRLTAVGSVEMAGGPPARRAAPGEAARMAAEIAGPGAGPVEACFESDAYTVFAWDAAGRGLLGRRRRRRMAVLDGAGRPRLEVGDGRLLSGAAAADELGALMGSRGSAVAPRVYLVGDAGVMDLSGLVSPEHVLGAVRAELGGGGRRAVIVDVS